MVPVIVKTTPVPRYKSPVIVTGPRDWLEDIVKSPSIVPPRAAWLFQRSIISWVIGMAIGSGTVKLLSQALGLLPVPVLQNKVPLKTSESSIV